MTDKNTWEQAAMSGAYWSMRDNQILRRESRKGTSIYEIARILNRTPFAVRIHLNNVHQAERSKWILEEKRERTKIKKKAESIMEDIDDLDLQDTKPKKKKPRKSKKNKETQAKKPDRWSAIEL